eukprot:scaffold225109_cov32-Tisochrysis_lutea.AAC.1
MEPRAQAHPLAYLRGPKVADAGAYRNGRLCGYLLRKSNCRALGILFKTNDQTLTQRLLACDHFASEHHARSDLGADCKREKVRGAHSRMEAEADKGDAQARGGRRNSYIACEGQAQPSANGRPIDGGDYRHG